MAHTHRQRFSYSFSSLLPTEALIGFQGRRLTHDMQPDFCVPHPH